MSRREREEKESVEERDCDNFWLSCLSFDVMMRFRRIEDLTMENPRLYL